MVKRKQRTEIAKQLCKRFTQKLARTSLVTTDYQPTTGSSWLPWYLCLGPELKDNEGSIRKRHLLHSKLVFWKSQIMAPLKLTTVQKENIGLAPNQLQVRCKSMKITSEQQGRNLSVKRKRRDKMEEANIRKRDQAKSKAWVSMACRNPRWAKKTLGTAKIWSIPGEGFGSSSTLWTRPGTRLDSLCRFVT